VQRRSTKALRRMEFRVLDSLGLYRNFRL